jgi:hypothetical protein
MFEDLQIAIPSRSRWRDIKTVYNLSTRLWSNILVVIPHDQYDPYRASVPTDIAVVSFTGEGIHAKRQAILNWKKTGKIIMMDDDLKFYKRTRDGKKFPGTLPEQTEQMIEELVRLLDYYPMVGLTDKFMSQTKPRGYMECHRFNQILGFNRDLLPDPWPEFRVPHDEEHDVHLQLLVKGYKTAISTEWSKSDTPNARGGCSDWRNDEILMSAHEKLMELWPGIVTIDFKVDSKTDKITRKARYNWRAAKQIGNI